MKFYVYDVQNPDEIIAGTEKPRIVERGPYSFRENRTKIDIGKRDDNSDLFIQFGQYKAYYFDKETSCPECNKDDELKVLNVPLVGILFAYNSP